MVTSSHSCGPQWKRTRGAKKETHSFKRKSSIRKFNARAKAWAEREKEIKEGTDTKGNKVRAVLRERPHPYPTYKNGKPKEMSGPKKQQQKKASANEIQGG